LATQVGCAGNGAVQGLSLMAAPSAAQCSLWRSVVPPVVV
jgi:hypothetical protein